MPLGPVSGRLSATRFDLLPDAEKERLLFNIEAALLSKAKRGKRLEDLTDEVANELNVAKKVIQRVTWSKRFVTKLGSRLL